MLINQLMNADKHFGTNVKPCPWDLKSFSVCDLDEAYCHRQITPHCLLQHSYSFLWSTEHEHLTRHKTIDEMDLMSDLIWQIPKCLYIFHYKTASINTWTLHQNLLMLHTAIILDIVLVGSHNNKQFHPNTGNHHFHRQKMTFIQITTTPFKIC